MTLLLGLVVAVVVTWGARVAFITLLPADRLPPALATALQTATPAVLGALTIVSVLNLRDAANATTIGHLVAIAVAALLARLQVNLAFVVLGAIATAAILRLLGV